MEVLRNKYLLLSTRRPSSLKEILDRVPKPESAIPPNGLPIWKELPLNYKLPYVSAPKNEFVFTRNKVGKSLWESYMKPDFILYDPYAHEVSMKYEPLHDKHLHGFFRKNVNFRNLLNQGLATHHRDAVCSLKEFNQYRQFQYWMYASALRKELSKQDQLHMERFKLAVAKRYTGKQLEDIVKKSITRTKLKEEIVKREKEVKEKEERKKRCMKKYVARISKIEEDRRDRDRYLEIVGRHRQAKSDQRRLDLEDCQRRQRIRVMNSIRIKEEKYRVAKQALEQARVDHRQIQDENSWRLRCGVQTKMIKQTQKILAENHKIMQRNIIRREFAVGKARQKLEDKIFEMKYKQVQTRDSSGKLLEAYLATLQSSGKQYDRWLLRQSISTAIAGHMQKGKSASDKVEVLEDALVNLEKIEDVPVEVTITIDHLLERVIKETLAKKVITMFDEVLHYIVDSNVFSPDGVMKTSHTSWTKGKRLSGSDKSSTKGSNSGKMDNTSNVIKSHSALVPTGHRSHMSPRSHSHDSGAVFREISFGKVETIDRQFENENNLKTTKDRPPTPVPSISELVSAIVSEVSNDNLKFDFKYKDEKYGIGTSEFAEYNSFCQAVENLKKPIMKIVASMIHDDLKNKRKLIEMQKKYKDKTIINMADKLVEAILLIENGECLEQHDMVTAINITAINAFKTIKSARLIRLKKSMPRRGRKATVDINVKVEHYMPSQNLQQQTFTSPTIQPSEPNTIFFSIPHESTKRSN